MHIKVLPLQIPLVWEHIKYGIVQTGETPPEHLPRQYVQLLCDLLSEKAQCWVRLNENRIILNISITKILQNPTTDHRELYIDGFYAYQGTTFTGMEELFVLLKDFARQAECSRITTSTGVTRAQDILLQHGFQEDRISYKVELEDPHE